MLRARLHWKAKGSLGCEKGEPGSFYCEKGEPGPVYFFISPFISVVVLYDTAAAVPTQQVRAYGANGGNGNYGGYESFQGGDY